MYSVWICTTSCQSISRRRCFDWLVHNRWRAIAQFGLGFSWNSWTLPMGRSLLLFLSSLPANDNIPKTLQAAPTASGDLTSQYPEIHDVAAAKGRHRVTSFLASYNKTTYNKTLEGAYLWDKKRRSRGMQLGSRLSCKKLSLREAYISKAVLVCHLRYSTRSGLTLLITDLDSGVKDRIRRIEKG